MFAPTADRVKLHTSAVVNEQIARDMHDRVTRLAETGPNAIDARLRKLDFEWDIERVLEMNFAGVVLACSFLGRKVHRAFYAIPPIAAGFMMQHVVSGWCPPLPFLRKAGVRTAKEIETERTALRALRLDYDTLSAEPLDEAVDEVLDAADFPLEDEL